jgi:hypothetical protein
MSSGNIYRDALEVLRRDGWTKEVRHDPDSNEKCLVGALDSVCGRQVWYDDPILEPLNEIARTEFGYSDGTVWGAAVIMNDDRSTRFGDIETLLEKAAAG